MMLNISIYITSQRIISIVSGFQTITDSNKELSYSSNIKPNLEETKTNVKSELDSKDFPPSVELAHKIPYIHCRLLNFEPITSLKNIKANYFGW